MPAKNSRTVASVSAEKPDVSLELITPELAEELLKLNSNNRHLSNPTLAVLMRAMASGRWINDGNPIRISWDNVILDGQHRLLAAVDTGETFESVVVRNLDPQCFASIDGGKPRTAADATSVAVAGMAGAGRKSAFARRVLLWESPRGIGSNASFTSIEIVDWIISHIDEINEMYSYERPSIASTKLRQGSTYDLLFWLFSKVDPSKAVLFFEELASGVDRPEGSPFISLEKAIHRTVKVLEDKGNGIKIERQVSALASNGAGRLRMVSLVIKAWNMWLAGETCEARAMQQPAEIPAISGLADLSGGAA